MTKSPETTIEREIMNAIVEAWRESCGFLWIPGDPVPSIMDGFRPYDGLPLVAPLKEGKQ